MMHIEVLVEDSSGEKLLKCLLPQLLGPFGRHWPWPRNTSGRCGASRDRRFAIVDANVVVAALLTSNVAAPVARLLDGMLCAAFPFVVSEDLLRESRTVLLRPPLRKLHGLKVAEIDTLLTDIAQHAIVTAPAASAPAPDPGDQFLWDLLGARSDHLLVTGDKQLLNAPGMQERVLSARAFLAMEGVAEVGDGA